MTIRRLWGAIAVMLVLGVLIPRAGALDWPQWRGPARDGVSREAGLLAEWPADGPRLVWQLKEQGDGYSTPAVAGERMVMMTNEGVDDEFVRAYGVKDGGELWKTRIGKVGNPKQQPSFPAARSTPTIDGEFVYVLSSDGDIACLSLGKGDVQWKKYVREEFGGKPGQWAYAESPLVDGDVVVCSPGGADATILALNRKTGAEVWRCAVPEGDDAAYASAIVVNAGGRKQYVQFLSKGVVGVDADSGKFLWRYNETGGGPGNTSTPVAQGDLVYSAAGRIGGGLVSLASSDDGVAATQVYIERGLPNNMGGSVLVDGNLFGTTKDGLVCADFATGKVKWTEKSVAPASLCYAGGRLYLHGDENDIALVEPSSDGYQERGRFKLPEEPEHTRGGMEKAWTYPLVANGRLYIRDLGTVWCYDVSGGGR